MWRCKMQNITALSTEEAGTTWCWQQEWSETSWTDLERQGVTVAQGGCTQVFEDISPVEVPYQICP